MRKQYHLRESDRGLLAWDVDRLVELAIDLPRHRLPLDSIREIEEPFWFSGETKPTCIAIVEHVRLMEEANLSFPIILSPDGRVMDGMHRVCKALLEARTSIEAVRFRQEPEPDYVGCQPDELPY